MCHRKGTAHLYSYINRATSPSNVEPNLSLNLEIADLINSKKGNMPRDAAVAIVHKINSLNPITSLLAIALLDMLVKNCGYPFHLQIATKEFLNELVRRFPERPPPRPSRVQFRILELLEQWKQTLCTTSRYKDDMGYVRDMHRLLHYKGYDFPQINEGAASVLNPNESLKSAGELEEEDRAAHSAKLQELIRRGTPQDLAEANQLMKVMAGFDQNKTDYRAKAAAEVDQIRRKAALLVEMLSGITESDTMTDGDIYQELADSIRNAQPKLQKMCEEESDDQAAVQQLFELNDSINSIVAKYEHLKRGDFAGAQRLPTSIPTAPTSDSVSTGIAPSTQSKFAQDLNLLDFDPEEPSKAVDNAAPVAQQQAVSQGAVKTNEMDDLLGLNFGGMDAFGTSGSISLGQASAPAAPTTAAKSYTNPMDAFASLNMGGPLSSAASPAPVASKAPISVHSSSSLNINITLNGGHGNASDPLKAQASFTNASNETINEIDFQVAVPKTIQVRLDTATSKSLRPHQSSGVTQAITLSSQNRPAGPWTVKLRYKVTYTSNGQQKVEQGQVAFDA
ncbi:Putative uncharacterized protein [Taphrina deformans PYCC 5710]|uniref:VHS domain protein n=1 Tax=Taphrina deformans (strain PYCC 5710 / ATCC 11124 / CBS 356.35 / IMI 108563 / JCM 9778 / NBRC 8474) TaxID=1097556 RepID=R4X6V5_TAPDE|nr:Putative uncharacterized protein [Taphrina deformans PYCC 5710]|eukprot:CCG80691.1 Putative uncharacterized protein [Taphrina deformans PYCC 5710]